MALSAASVAAKSALDEHEGAVDALHHKLAALSSDADSHERLERAMQKYKAAHATLTDDVLGIVGTQK